MVLLKGVRAIQSMIHGDLPAAPCLPEFRFIMAYADEDCGSLAVMA